jgi:hypothetical protein
MLCGRRRRRRRNHVIFVNYKKACRLCGREREIII